MPRRGNARPASKVSFRAASKLPPGWLSHFISLSATWKDAAHPEGYAAVLDPSTAAPAIIYLIMAYLLSRWCPSTPRKQIEIKRGLWNRTESFQKKYE